MYATPVSAVHPELVSMAGGANAVVIRASELVEAGQIIEGLHLANIALKVEPKNEAALQVRLTVLEKLEDQATNSNERGWLRYGIRMTKASLADLGKEP